MTKSCITALVVAAAVALPAVAEAKGPTDARVCGPSDCVAIEREHAAWLMVDRGDRTLRQPALGAYYRVDFTFRVPDGRIAHEFAHLFVPSADRVAAGGEAPGSVAWFEATGPALDELRRAVDGLDPFPAPATWPTSIETDAFVPRQPTPPATDSVPWERYAFVTALLAGSLALFIIVRRTRLRKATTA